MTQCNIMENLKLQHNDGTHLQEMCKSLEVSNVRDIFRAVLVWHKLPESQFRQCYVRMQHAKWAECKQSLDWRRLQLNTGKSKIILPFVHMVRKHGPLIWQKNMDFRILCLCTMHCNIIIWYKPTKCTFVKLSLILWCLLHVSNPRGHLQEDGCMYSYGIICLH